MRNTVLLLSALIGLVALAGPPTNTPHIVPAKVGLVLIGAAPDGLVLAADGSSLNADGRVSQEQKLFPAGKQGAVAIAGTVSLQDPVGRRVRGEVNVARIAAAWLADHAGLDIKAADHDLNVAVATAVNQFFSTRDPGAQKGAFKFAIVSAGFLDGKPVVTVTRYFLPALKGKPMRTEHTSTPAQPGEMWIFGSSGVPSALLAEKSTVLAEVRKEPAVQKFHTTASADLAVQDYVNLFDQVLRGAESNEGKKVDGKRAIVAPPNRVGTVTLKDGFVAAPSH
jgi:hypothetical protein